MGRSHAALLIACAPLRASLQGITSSNSCNMRQTCQRHRMPAATRYNFHFQVPCRLAGQAQALGLTAPSRCKPSCMSVHADVHAYTLASANVLCLRSGLAAMHRCCQCSNSLVTCNACSPEHQASTEHVRGQELRCRRMLPQLDGPSLSADSAVMVRSCDCSSHSFSISYLVHCNGTTRTVRAVGGESPSAPAHT